MSSHGHGLKLHFLSLKAHLKVFSVKLFCVWFSKGKLSKSKLKTRHWAWGIIFISGSTSTTQWWCSASERFFIQQQNSGVVSGCRQICLLWSASLSQTPGWFACVPGVFIAPQTHSEHSFSLWKHSRLKLYSSPHPQKPAMYREGTLGQGAERASDSSRWLCSEGPGIGSGRLTWQSHPYGSEWKWCLCQRWITVVIQRDPLACFGNHTLFCCSQAALHLI